MTTPLLTRQSHRARARPALTVAGELSLALARVHEICGPARRTLAAMVAAGCEGPVFWIAPAWQPEGPNAEGLRRFLDPGRITFLAPERREDLLWTMEEVLRSGAVPLAIAEIPAPPALTPVRRLHLAAETGAAEGGIRPLGLLLTPGEGGAQGVESRWHMGFAHGADGSERWTLSRRRARTEPQKAWRVHSAANGLRLDPLPPDGA